MTLLSTTHYMDVRGVPWEIRTYDVPQVLTGTAVVVDSGGSYRDGYFGAASEDDATSKIDLFAKDHARVALPLDDAHRPSEVMRGGVWKYSIEDPDGNTWPVYRIVDKSEGPPGMYAANAESFASQVVGPSATMTTLRDDLKRFRNLSSTTAKYAVGDTSSEDYVITWTAVDAPTTGSSAVPSTPSKWFVTGAGVFFGVLLLRSLLSDTKTR